MLVTQGERYPLVNVYITVGSIIFHGKFHYEWWFSIISYVKLPEGTKNGAYHPVTEGAVRSSRFIVFRFFPIRPWGASPSLTTRLNPHKNQQSTRTWVNVRVFKTPLDWWLQGVTHGYAALGIIIFHELETPFLARRKWNWTLLTYFWSYDSDTETSRSSGIIWFNCFWQRTVTEWNAFGEISHGTVANGFEDEHRKMGSWLCWIALSIDVGNTGTPNH